MSTAKNNQADTKARISDVQKRRLELETEAQTLKATIAERASELPRVYFERGDVTKLLEAQSNDSKRLAALRDALVVADQALAELDRSLNAEKLQELAVSKVEFNDRVVKFIDGPLAALCTEFEELSKQFYAVMDKASQAGGTAQYPGENFPFIQKHIYDFLWFYFNKNSLPTDLENLRKTYKDYFVAARKAAK